MWKPVEVSFTLGPGKIMKHVLQEFVSVYMKNRKTGTPGYRAWFYAG